MLYWSECAGTPVFLNQKKIGHIDNIMLDPDKKMVSGFLLERRNRDIRHRCFSLLEIDVLKKDRIELKESIEIETLSKSTRKKLILEEDFIHHSILDEKGEWIGRIVDFSFDPVDGFVREIILSGSLLEDLWLGRKRMPVLGQVEFSRELIHIDQDTREEITELCKGLKNWLDLGTIQKQ